MFVPRNPRYTRDEAAAALSESVSWADALRRLGVAPRGKNFATIRKWATHWDLPTSHLAPYRPRKASPRFTEEQAREAIAASRSWTEALRRLGYCPTGGNPRTLKSWSMRWHISTNHFDPGAASREALARHWNQPIPLADVLVPDSEYPRASLKQRLYGAGLKQPVCEMCGQDEVWNGHPIGMTIDHINGVRNDNRIENLRILCPNCAATLDTHCGRNKSARPAVVDCRHCGNPFRRRFASQRYCSRECGIRWDRSGRPLPSLRRVARPPYEQLVAEIAATSYEAVGRRYGVSGNAIRKWVRFYERERERVDESDDRG